MKNRSDTMKRCSILALAIAIGLLTGCTADTSATAADIVIYKSATCPCCDDWVTHMQKEGFRTRTETRDDMDSIKATYGITTGLASCHTALIGGYVIEGHVPAADVKRLLKERPADVIGLTAPGMPMKSPGMQAEGLKPEGYDVIAFKKDGSTEVFTRY
ncbi:MAG: DUF411 domain-containing protein [Mariprofundaceae bacterium]|nr:DUF411 domain-containing protein [Mariprofundaceae bacterium]